MFNPGIKLVCFDFDGTFTDGQFYISSNGDCMKSYNGRDIYAIKMLKDKGVKTGLIISDNSTHFDYISKMNHFDKLDYFYEGLEDKFNVIDKWRKDLDIYWNEIAYIGDDSDDLRCLNKVGISACPADAISEIQSVCIYRTKSGGGKGAIREFVDYLMKQSYLQKY